MRNLNITLLLFILSVYTVICQSNSNQNDINKLKISKEQIIDSLYYKDLELTPKELFPKIEDSIIRKKEAAKFRDSIQGLIENSKKEKEKLTDTNKIKEIDKYISTLEIEIYRRYNIKLMNVFFSEEVSNYFSSSQDLSLQRFYTSLTINDNSLTLGANIDLRGVDKMKKLNWIFTPSIKLSAKDKFATIFKDDNFQGSDIALKLKLTKIGLGTIGFKQGKSKLDLSAYTNYKIREKVFEALDEKLKKYNNKEIETIMDSIEFSRALYKEITNLDCLEDYQKKKIYIYYKDLIKSELSYLKKLKLYNHIRDSWFSFDLNIPLGKNTYSIFDTNNDTINKVDFYEFKASIIYTYFIKWSSGHSLYFTPKVNFKNNNNILVNSIKEDELQTLDMAFPNRNLISTESVYNLDFKRFSTFSSSFEVTYLWELKRFKIGLSPAFEKNYGEYDALNWKIGIPLSLPDKDGKPKVNFELQYKKVKNLTDSNSFFGISANIFLGSIIN